MASPKKKLPTGPIRIDHPKSWLTDTPSQTSEQRDSQANRIESAKQESTKQDFSVQENNLLDSTNLPTLSGDLNAPPWHPTKPESLKQDSSLQEDRLNESPNLNTISQGLNAPPLHPDKPESIKQDSSLQENNLDFGKNNTPSQNLNEPVSLTGKQESIKQDSIILENSSSGFTKDNTITDELVEPHQPETGENAGLPAREQESSFTESKKQESDIESIEYKKVAMRLSKEAVNKLRELRTTTELPYEVLVDVMIRNWDNLPALIQKHYLSEARRSRVQRLIAGQDKAMKTVRNKLLD